MDCNCYYRITLKLSSLLCITPRYDFTNEEWKNLRTDKWKATALVTVLIISTIANSLGQHVFLTTSVPKTIAFLLTIKTIVVFLTNFNALQVLHFKKQEDCCKLFKLMMAFCVKLNCRSRYNARKYYVFTLLYCVYLIGLDVHETWFFGTAYKYSYGQLVQVVEKIQSFYVYIISLFVYALLDNVTWYWKELNYQLLIKKKDPAAVCRIGEVCGWFKLLCDVNDGFNKIFGYHIFVMIITIVVYIVTPLHGIIVNANNDDTYFGLRTNMHMLIILLSQTITSLLVGITIIQKCEDIRNLTQETTTICYDLIFSFRANLNDNKEAVEELTLLTQQISTRNVNISAAGYFSVDHTTLFAMMNIILSYLVILAQFHVQTS